MTVICGDGTDLRLLEEEQVGLYDLFASVTADDEVNLMAGLLAKRAGVGGRSASCSARSTWTSTASRHRRGAQPAAGRLREHPALRPADGGAVPHALGAGPGEVLEMVASAGSRIVGTPISRLHMPRGVLLLRRSSPARKVTVPSGSDSVHAGDTVILLCLASARQAVERLFRSREL
ncbi:MAG: NAD-binding protein [Deltaproteobacteria bacterium]|nr:NAD-binding protein [Deltaproteobacteria bacterium]